MASAPTTEETPLLSVVDIHVDFHTPDETVHAVRGATFSMSAGECLGLVGESGSGKSVTALSLCGLLPRGRSTVSGSVRLEGRELVGLTESDLERVRGSKIAYAFQDPLSSLNPSFTIANQIGEALRTHLGHSKQQARRRTLELLQLVGIPGAGQRLDDYPHQFSGGMRQRVMIAMALACEPQLLVADEPTTALDVTVQAQLLDLISRLRRELGMAVLLITHDLGVVAGVADRTAVMYAGRVVEMGSTAEMLSHPRHPYTGGLLRSIPRLDQSKDKPLVPIDGQPPDLTTELVGCPFQPRCGWSIDRCGREDPPDTFVTEGHRVACWVQPDLALDRPGR